MTWPIFSWSPKGACTHIALLENDGINVNLNTNVFHHFVPRSFHTILVIFRITFPSFGTPFNYFWGYFVQILVSSCHCLLVISHYFNFQFGHFALSLAVSNLFISYSLFL